MARVSYNLLPVEGPKFPRDVSRVVNGAMSGQQNCVFDFAIPAGTIDQAGETFRVFDVRVSQQKYLSLAALNAAAELADVFITEIGNGFFDVTSLPVELLFAQVQVSQIAGSMGSLIGAPIIPFNTVDLNNNFTVDLANNRIISNIVGVIQVSFSISGNYQTGTIYEFGIRKFDNITDQNLLQTFSVATSTSNQNSLVAISANILLDEVPGNYIELFGDSNTVGSFTPYEIRLNGVTTSPNRGTPVLDELQYRCLVIG